MQNTSIYCRLGLQTGKLDLISALNELRFSPSDKLSRQTNETCVKGKKQRFKHAVSPAESLLAAAHIRFRKLRKLEASDSFCKLYPKTPCGLNTIWEKKVELPTQRDPSMSWHGLEQWYLQVHRFSHRDGWWVHLKIGDPKSALIPTQHFNTFLYFSGMPLVLQRIALAWGYLRTKYIRTLDLGKGMSSHLT